MAKENTIDYATDAVQSEVPEETQGSREGITMSKGGLANGHSNVDIHGGLRLFHGMWGRKSLWSGAEQEWEGRRRDGE